MELAAPKFFVPENITDPLFARSSIASLFTASLELAKQGKLELRQDDNFRPIYLRAVDRPPLVDEIPSNYQPNHDER